MQEVSGSPTVPSDLSVPLSEKILQHVPQQQRLCQCACVCNAWATAAAQATVHVVKQRVDDDTVASLQSWLQLHAGQLQSLELAAKYSILNTPEPLKLTKLQLPLDKLTKLQRLQLNNFRLQLPGEEDSQGSRSATDSIGSTLDRSNQAAQLTLSSLQHLALSDAEVVGISSLLQLTMAPQLTSLQLQCIRVRQLGLDSFGFEYDDPLAAVQQLAQAMPGLLQQLPQLSVLKLPGILLTDSAMQQLSVMQQLQQLEYMHLQHVPSCDLQLLPSSITHLKLTDECDNHPTLAASLPMELPQLSGLLHLDLESCIVPVQVLGCFTQLRVLSMHDCSLLPRSIPEEEPNTEGTAALLEVLASLTLLQEFRYTENDLDTMNVAPQQYSALTASSHLTQLTLAPQSNWFKMVTLPKGAVQHMFPVGRQMQLQHLSITPCDVRDVWCLDAADLERIIRCCPHLLLLNISCCVEPGADLSALLQLSTTCKKLCIGGGAFTDEAAPTLLQLTQLRSLTWGCSRGFTDKGLEQLVGLDLEELCVLGCGVPCGTIVLRSASHHPTCDLSAFGTPVIHPTTFRSEGSVWQQLAALFEKKEPEVAARLSRHMAAAREQLRVEVGSLREQLADRDQHLALKNQQLAGRDQQLARKDQQLADRDQQLAHKDQQLADRDQQLASEDQQLADRDQQLADMERQLACSQAEVERLKQQLAEACV